MPELTTLVQEIDSLTRIEDTEQVAIGIVVSSDMQDQTAARLLKESKAYRRDLKKDAGYLKAKAAVDAAVEQLRTWVRTHDEVLKERQDWLNGAIVVYRDEKAERVAAEARRVAELDRVKVEKKRKKEAARMERAAKKATGRDRADFLAEAEEILNADLPDVDAAGERARAESQKNMGGQGHGSTVKGWDVIVDDLEKLVAAVAASNPTILSEVRTLVKAKLAPIPVEALNCKRASGVLITSPWLTKAAASHGGDLRVPGVVVQQKRGTVRST